MIKWSKWHLIGIMVLALSVFGMGCEEDGDDEGGLSSTEGYETSPQLWDMAITPMSGSLEKYFVAVSTGGGNGVAVVTVTRNSGSGQENLGNHQVFEGVPIPLEPCGPTMTFSDSGAAFNLVAGDEWVVMNASGLVMGPFQTGVPGSTNLTVTAAPNLACGMGCSSGLFLGTPGYYLTPDMGANVLIGIQAQTSDYLIEGDIPEIYLLNFSTEALNNGDDIQVSYKRKLFSDKDDGDFLYVRLVNHRDYETVEEVRERDERDVRQVSYETTARGSFLGLIFSVGLSSSKDKVILDDFEVKVNGMSIFFEDFDDGSLEDGLTLLFSPEEKGSAGFTASAEELISGTQSYRFQGGRLFHLYGQQAEFEGTEGMLFNLTDGSIGGSFFLGAFMGATLQGIVSGMYSGRNYDSSCTEEGGFFVATEPKGSADASGTWQITMDAELANCDDPSRNGNQFKHTYSGVVLDQTQVSIGAMLIGNTVDDGESNQVQFMGFVAGKAVMLQMFTMVPATMYYSAALSGGVSELPTGGKIGGGQVMGFASPDPMRMWETCDITGTYEAATTP
jgi:hypothetical protein